METEIIEILDCKTIQDINKINHAADIIKSGGLVALPTETVYGLGADALNTKAVEKIFIAKGRPQDNPLIIHVAHNNDIEKYVKSIPEYALNAIRDLCPGAITFIMPKADIVPSIVSGGLDTVAIRVPAHSVMREIIKKSGTAIAAPSANMSTKPSPTCANHVADDMMGKIDMIVDGGESLVGIESTVVDVSGKTAVLLRPGGVGVETLKRYFPDLIIAANINKSVNIDAPKSPGMKYKHYSPKAEVVVIEGCNLENIEKKREEIYSRAQKQGKKCAFVIYGEKSEVTSAVGQAFYMENIETYTSKLFFCLRELDKLNPDLIIATLFSGEDSPLILGLRNRLYKAAGGNIVYVV